MLKASETKYAKNVFCYHITSIVYYSHPVLALSEDSLLSITDANLVKIRAMLVMKTKTRTQTVYPCSENMKTRIMTIHQN